MKKLYAIALLAAAAVTPLAANAQEQTLSAEEEVVALKAELKAKNDQEKYNEIWKRHKAFDLAYISSSWDRKGFENLPSNYGFGLRLGNTYWLHKKPIAGMIKIGLDAVWMDLNYVNLKSTSKGTHINGNDFIPGGELLEDLNDIGFGYGDDDEEPDLDFDLGSLGSHMLEFNMGVGPSINIAPLSFLNNQAKYLRASLYCHFSPSFSAVLCQSKDNEGNEDTQFNYAFVPYVTFGGSISWKALRIFCEGRWGSANYNMGKIDGEEIVNGTVACKSNMVRVGFGLTY